MGGPLQANNPTELIAYLQQNKEFAAGLTLILMQDQIPLYAVQPAGPFAEIAYDKMFDALISSIQESGSEQRISLPGFISGSTRLMNGMTVPVVVPDPRGVFRWRSRDLVVATREIAGDQVDSDEQLMNYLNRVYYELRNLGVSPQDRAINHSATNAYQPRGAFVDAAARSLVLDTIRVVKSRICRPDSDCWDVELVMFDDDDERKPNWVYRFTVDVAEVIPVTVGPVRSWAARARS
jgi:cyanobactin maturation PatA/PatG family protease